MKLVKQKQQLRIAVVCSQYPVASETFIRAQVAMLLDRGHDVHVFANVVGNYTPPHSAMDDEIARRTHYTHWPTRGGFFSQAAKALVIAALRAPRAPRVLWPAVRNLHHLMNPSHVPGYFNSMAFWAHPGFDVILSHFGHVGQQIAEMASLGMVSGKLATVLHGEDVSKHLRDHGNDAYKALFTQNDLLLPVSQHWADVIQAAGCAPQKILVQHMGIDTQRIAFRPRVCAAEAKVHFISVCRLVEKKGLEFALRAIAHVKESFQANATYTIIGDGPLRAQLESLSESLGLSQCVQFAGWKSHGETLDALNASHILIAPSVTATDGDMEGIPVSIMEAMASGLPVISTFHSGIPELIEDGVSGVLVKERDAPALAAAIEQLRVETGTWDSIGQAARLRVEALFDNHALATQLEECLTSLAVSADQSGP